MSQFHNIKENNKGNNENDSDYEQDEDEFVKEGAKDMDDDIDQYQYDDDVDDDVENQYDDHDNEDEDNINEKEEEDEDADEDNNMEGGYNTDADEDDDGGDINEFQKLNKDMTDCIITDYHQELLQPNIEEIELLSTVIRDADNNIIDPLHKSVPLLSKYEKTAILGKRASQLNKGATSYVNVDATMIDGKYIAELELKEGKIPFKIKRTFMNGTFEIWNISDLEDFNH